MLIQNKLIHQVIFIGNQRVGKTSIVSSWIGHVFEHCHKATIGADVYSKQIIAHQKSIHLEIWDTAGMDELSLFGSAFYQGSHCCVLVFDITDRKSFENIEVLTNELLKYVKPKQPPIILFGNKIDCTETREVTDEDILKLLQKFPQAKYLASSAKTGQGLDSAFQTIGLVSADYAQKLIGQS